MNFSNIKNTIAPIFFAIGLSACGGGEGGDTVVVNSTETLKENTFISYTLEAGTYTAEITASNEGVDVKWVGGNGCTASKEIKTYKNACTLSGKGQLTITNSTLFGLGATEIATVKITKHQ